MLTLSLKKFIQDRALIDLGYTGPAFNWSNGAIVEKPIFERLDRAVCNTDLFFIFPDNGLLHIPKISSDHYPILHDIVRKIMDVGKKLNEWCRKIFGNIFRTVEDRKEKLLKVQMEAHLRDTRMEEKVLYEEIEQLNVMQQRYYEHRSKVKWIPNMDKNTRVFHLSFMQRKKKNQIDALKLPNGTWVTEANDIIHYLVNHFNGLFKKDPDEDMY
ncbi:uncharacterized protein LOC113312448 [Papaver somniferum]|uniref:uncharacterized protein LOC113312448 n=1 Tax=Papaver somniferum TaxID=3469 RepID=UPI000E704305|nr:uncharacterized protein LOC113312448 [Papaver somniferum]